MCFSYYLNPQYYLNRQVPSPARSENRSLSSPHPCMDGWMDALRGTSTPLDANLTSVYGALRARMGRRVVPCARYDKLAVGRYRREPLCPISISSRTFLQR